MHKVLKCGLNFGMKGATRLFGNKLYPLCILAGCIILSAQLGKSDTISTGGGVNGTVTANLANYLCDACNSGGPNGYYSYLTQSYQYFSYDLQISIPTGDVLTDATVHVGAVGTSGVTEYTTSQACTGSGNCPYINYYTPGLGDSVYELEDPVTNTFESISGPGTYDLMSTFGAGLANGDPIEVLGYAYLTDGFNYEYYTGCGFFGCNTASNTVYSTEQGSYSASGNLTLTYGPNPAPVPEVSSIMLLGTALLGLGRMVRHKFASKT